MELKRAVTIVPQGEDVIPIEFWYEDSFVFVRRGRQYEGDGGAISNQRGNEGGGNQ